MFAFYSLVVRVVAWYTWHQSSRKTMSTRVCRFTERTDRMVPARSQRHNYWRQIPYGSCHGITKSQGVKWGSVLSPFMFALYLDNLSKLGSSFKGCCMILYADDILILSLSVSQLEHLLHACESELAWLDIAINFSKSCCIHVGPRCDKSCANISSKTGSNIPWVTEMRYLGVTSCNPGIWHVR